MKDFDALKNIWHGQAATPKLTCSETINVVRKSQSAMAGKLLTETVIMLGIIIFLILVWINQPFIMWTSHLSLVVLIVCCLYYLVVQLLDYRNIILDDSHTKEPSAYIEYLNQYKRKRYTLNTRHYAVYSIFIGIALALYFVEVYYVAPLWQTLTGLGFTIGWFLFCAYLMRIYIRNEQAKLNGMIQHLESLRKQFIA